MTNLVGQEPLLFQNGERLTRDEFIARWERMPQLKFAELIDGEVYVPSPLSLPHSQQDSILQGWGFTYNYRSGLVDSFPNATWLLLESAPQPDLVLRLRAAYGGQSGATDNLGSGPPEFVAEVAVSSRSYDLGPKLKLYERAGVREYLAALVEERRLEWRVLREGRYVRISADNAGTYRSEIFPGLWLNEPAFWNNDVARVMEVLEEGLRSPEFLAFQNKHLHR
jgi:hypothetical protein